MRLPQDVALLVPVNPVLPRDFDNTPNDARPPSHTRWWNVPYIVTYTWEQMSAGSKESPEQLATRRAEWFAAWPSGTRYDVRCLDGGGWDRSTCWGGLPTLEEAYARALGGKAVSS